MRSWIVEYRPKCGCTALKEPVDCGQGFRVYTEPYPRKDPKGEDMLTDEQRAEASELATDSVGTLMRKAAQYLNKIDELKAELDRVRAERDGFRNGQAQAQHIVNLALDEKLGFQRECEQLRSKLAAAEMIIEDLQKFGMNKC